MRKAVPSICFLLAAAALLAPAAAQSDAGGVTATLELSQQFYYAGDPFFIRVSIGNNGESKVANPVKTPLLEGFDVRADGVKLEARGNAKELEPARPGNLAARSFYGVVVDLAEIYPDLKKVGEYEVSWSADGLSSRTLVVRMLPKYDPEKSYFAEIETDSGKIVIDFASEEAPIAVKAFIDMANAGFYDGMAIHEIRKDQYVAAGDPGAAPAPRNPVVYPAELTPSPVVAGSVVMKPVRAAPPANASIFMILLRPEPSWNGQVTVFGQVVDGLAVARAISREPSSQVADQPIVRPNRDIRIRGVRIKEKPAAAAR
jgi:cyclophilin family peptidyl-prolyl cis-trans isomerase